MKLALQFVASGDSTTARMAGALASRLLSPDVDVRVAGEPGCHPLAPEASRALEEVGLSGSHERETSCSQEPVDLLVTLGEEPDVAALPKHLERQHWRLAPSVDTGGLSALDWARASRDALIERLIGLASRFAPEPAVGIIGGSGFYDLPGMTDVVEASVDTPFGPPSSPALVGRLGESRVVFLARHGRGHALLPSEVNARANVYALKRLGVTKLISVSAVGSLRDMIAPGHVVFPRQFLDRTAARPSTYFGGGVVGHVSLASPVCAGLADSLIEVAGCSGATIHCNGTYVCIEGPQFSTRAESLLFRSWGADVVGMTNLPEARLAREAELCYATLAMPTDYDCWRARDEDVRVTDVLAQLRSNVEMARRIIAAALPHIDPASSCACQRVLDTSMVTSPDEISPSAVVRLHAIVERRIRARAQRSASAW